MEEQTLFVAKSGSNQATFKDIETLIQYFTESGEMFKSIYGDLTFYEVHIKQIKSPLIN